MTNRVRPRYSTWSSAGVLLAGIHPGRTILDREADAAHVQTHEVRHQPDYRRVANGFPMLQAFHPDDAGDPFLRAPPEDAAFEDCPREQLEVPAHEAAPFRFGQRGKTQPHVGQPDMAALPSQGIGHDPERSADRCEHRQRQEMQQPDDRKSYTGHSAGRSQTRLWQSARAGVGRRSISDILSALSIP